MKILTSLCLMLLMMTNIYAADPVEIRVNAADKTFQVALPSNPSTGYQWTVKSYDNQILKLVSSIYTPSESNLAGAGGAMVFTFERLNQASVPDNTVMEFSYERPWEKAGGTSQTVTIVFSEY